MVNLTHRNRFSQFTLCLGEFRSAAVPPPQRGGLFCRPFRFVVQNGNVLKPFTNHQTVRMRPSPPRWGGGTAALNFEAIKPRIFNAVAVGEMHHITAPSRLITKNKKQKPKTVSAFRFLSYSPLTVITRHSPVYAVEVTYCVTPLGSTSSWLKCTWPANTATTGEFSSSATAA